MPWQELRRRLHRHHVTTGQLFSFMDSNRDDKITYSEFKRGLAMSGVRPIPTELETHALFASFDTNRDMLVSYKEMVEALERTGKGSRPGSRAGRRGGQ